MTKTELIAQVAREANVKKVDAEKAVNAFIKVVSETLKSKDRLSLAGFGTFVVAQRKARKGRNPQTGEAITIAAARKVGFKAARNLKSAIALAGDVMTRPPHPKPKK